MRVRVSGLSAFLAVVALLCATGCSTSKFFVSRGAVMNVRARGAIGDGKTNCTEAFQKTIDQCAAAGGGSVFVPSGDYLIGAIRLKSNTTLLLQRGATLVASSDAEDYPLDTIRWEGRWRQGHRALISAVDAHDVAVVGPGHILGNGTVGHLRNPRGPALVEFIRCKNVRVEGFSTQHERMWSIHPTCCENVLAKGLTIRSTGTISDGIDVDSCKHVRIENCNIATGDDCIAIKSGRGMEGYKAAMPSADVKITSCTLGDSNFACLALGSESSGGICGVTIERCHFTHARSNAIYIKSNWWRGAGIENVIARDLTVDQACNGFLTIDLVDSGKTDEVPVMGDEGIPYGKNFKFSNVRLNGCGQLLDATKIADKRPLEGLVFKNVTGTCVKGMALANVRDVNLTGVSVVIARTPALRIQNVTGKGLAGAVPFDHVLSYVKPATVPKPNTRPRRRPPVQQQ